MLPSWLRQFKNRLVGRGAGRPVRRPRPRSEQSNLLFEMLEDRSVPAVAIWTGAAIPEPTTGQSDARWSNPNNWLNGVAPYNAGDDVIFPPVTGANKPPAVVSNGVFFWPNGTHNDPTPTQPVNGGILANSLVDANPFSFDGSWTIGRFLIQDDNYHIDAFIDIPQIINIQDAIVADIPQTLGQLTGLSLIGPQFAPGGTAASNLRINLNGPNQEIRSDNVGILRITASIFDSPINGESGFLKTGVGAFNLAGNNFYTGSVRVGEGTLIASDSQALGTVDKGTSVDALPGTTVGATLAVSFGATISDSVTLRGAGVNSGGALIDLADPFATFNPPLLDVAIRGTLVGGVTLVGNVSFGGNGGILDFAGPGISGGGTNLTKVGSSRHEFFVANTYSHNTLITQGSIAIFDSNALSNSSFATTSTTVFNGAALFTNAGLAVPETLFLNGNGFSDAAGRPLGALNLESGFGSTWLGTITLQSNASIGATLSSQLLLSGALGGAPDLGKVDQGNVRIARANDGSQPVGFAAFTGNTTVSNGTLEIAHELALGTAGTVTVTSTSGMAGAAGTLQMEGEYTFNRPLALAGVGFNTQGAVHLVNPVGGGTSAISLAGGVNLVSAASVNTDAGTTLTINSAISGTPADNTTTPPIAAASFEKTGAGTLVLSNDNTYTGATALRAGLTQITTAQAFGDPIGDGTTVFAGGTLQLLNPLSLTEDLTLSGTGLGGNGALLVPAGASSVTGLVSLLGIDSTRADINIAAGGSMAFTNVVSGDADLHLIGPGELQYTGTNDNTHNGRIFIDNGTLALATAPGVNAVGGMTFSSPQLSKIVVGDSIGANNSAQLRLDAPNQIPEVVDGVTIVVSALRDGLINLNGSNETLGGLALTGAEVVTGTGILTLASDVDVFGSSEPSRINGSVDLGGATRTFSTRGNAGLTFFASSNPVQFQSSVTFTVQLDTTGGPNATGSVRFTRINPTTGARTTLGTGTVIGNQATFSTSNLPAGSFIIEAAYLGDANYAPQSINLPSNLLVVGAPTRSTVSSNQNPTGGGVTFTYTGTALTGNPVPTGTVTFFADGSPIGTRTLTGGSTTLSTFLATGTYVITAQYNGDQFNAPQTVTLGTVTGGVPTEQRVVDAPQFQISLNTNPVVSGRSIRFTLTGTQQPGNPAPTGSVTFFVNGAAFDTGTLDANGDYTSPTPVLIGLAAGDYTVTAQYFGDALYEPQIITLAPPLKVLAAPAANAILAYVTSNRNQAQPGDPITFSFEIIPQTNPATPTATGRVIFLANGIPLNNDMPSFLAGGVATYTTRPNLNQLTTSGVYTITAQYRLGNYADMNVVLAPNQTVINPLAIQLASSQNVAPMGTSQSITFAFTAVRQSALDPAPTGTVNFFDGATLLSATAVPLVFNTFTGVGSASFTVGGTTPLGFGTHNIRAVYSGDANYPQTEVTLAPTQQVVNPAVFRVTSDDFVSQPGQNVTFSFTSQAAAGTTTPSGTVTFLDNGVPIPGGSNLALAGGNRTFTTNALTLGTHVITVAYSGDSFHEPITVTLAPNQVVAATDPTPPASTAPAQGAALEENAVITGASGAGIIKNGLGTMTLTTPNLYTGPTAVASGVLILGTNDALPDTALTISATGTLNVNGFTDAVASLSGTGTLALGTGSLTTGQDNASTTFSGPITGSGRLSKVGTGTLTLTGNSPAYTGTTTVAGGTVEVNANHGNASVSVLATGTLAGIGPVGPITVATGGTVSPGTGGATPTTATLNSNGSVAFSNNASFVVQVNGTGAGQFDRLAATGTVNLGGARLILTFDSAFSPAVGTAINLVTATGGLSGQFRDGAGNLLADGAIFTADGLTYRINYTANNVTLTVTAYALNVALVSTSNPSTPGAAVSFTATFTPVRAGAPTPTGAVLLRNNGVTFGSGTLSSSVNSITASTTFATTGTFVITAEYAGDANYAASTTTLNQVVNIPTTTTLVTSAGRIEFGQSATFTATVTTSGTGTPTGTVTFVNATTGTTLGTVALGANGQASLTVPFNTAGTFTIRATYSGDTSFRTSSATVTEVVNRRAPFFTNAIVIGNLLVIQGNGVPGGIAVIPVAPGSSALFTDINGDGDGDVILFLPNLVLVADGSTGRLLAMATDVNGDGAGDILLFNDDGTTTTIDGRTGRRTTV